MFYTEHPKCGTQDPGLLVGAETRNPRPISKVRPRFQDPGF